MQNRIYTGSATTRAYVQSSSKFHLSVFTNLVKTLYKQWTTKDFPPLCSVFTPRSKFHFLQWTPKDLSPLCLVITPRGNPTSCNEPQRTFLLCVQWLYQEANFASCNEPQRTLLLCVQWFNQGTNLFLEPSRPSLENFYNQESVSWKAFCKNGGEEENRITQVFAQWTFLDKVNVEQKLLERCSELAFLKFVSWSHIYSHLMDLEETMLKVVTFGNFFKTNHFKKLWLLAISSKNQSL